MTISHDFLQIERIIEESYKHGIWGILWQPHGKFKHEWFCRNLNQEHGISADEISLRKLFSKYKTYEITDFVALFEQISWQAS